MFLKRGYIRQVLLVGLALILSQCGGSAGKDTQVELSIIPPSPIVFTSDIHLTQNGTATTITGPWFKFGVSINNTSDTPITVIGLEVTVSGIGTSGTMTNNKTTVDPTQFNYSNLAVTCTYSDFGVFDPKGTPIDPLVPTYCPSGGTYTNSAGKSFTCTPFNLIPLVVNNYSLYMLPSGSGCALGIPQFYIGSNPTGPNHDNFNLQVKIKPLGWFGDRDHPTDRFENFTTVTTQ